MTPLTSATAFASLRELAAERPAHAALLERMVAEGHNTVPAPRPSRLGVTRRAYDALVCDLDWIVEDSTRPHPPMFPGAYAAWVARVAYDAERKPGAEARS